MINMNHENSEFKSVFQERSSANLTSDTRLSYEDSGSNDSSYESYGFNEISFVERYLGSSHSKIVIYHNI